MAKGNRRSTGFPQLGGVSVGKAVPTELPADLAVLLGDAERKQRGAMASEFSVGPGNDPDTYHGRTPPCEPKTKLAARGSLPRPYLSD